MIRHSSKISIQNHSLPRCPYCHDSITMSAKKTGCEACMAWHHKDCWHELGGCSSCGVQNQASTSAQRSRGLSNDTQCSDPSCARAPQWSDFGTLDERRAMCWEHSEKALSDQSDALEIMSVIVLFAAACSIILALFIESSLLIFGTITGLGGWGLKAAAKSAQQRLDDFHAQRSKGA